MKLRSKAILGALMLVHAGCAPVLQSPIALDAAPRLRPEDPVKTVAAYRQLRAGIRESEAFRQATAEASSGPAKVTRLVDELAKLPSEPPRRFARELIAVLRRHGFPVRSPATIPPGVAETTYNELATISALTYALAATISQDECAHAGIQTPAQWINLDISEVIVASCPSDDAFLVQALCWFGRDYQEGGHYALSLGQAAPRWNRCFEASFARLTDSKRPLNLTSIEYLVALPGAGEIIICYAGSVSRPTGREFSNLQSAARHQLERARNLDASPETQEELNHALARSAELDSTWKSLDDRIASISDARRMLESFRKAKRTNSPAAAQFLGGSLRPQDAGDIETGTITFFGIPIRLDFDKPYYVVEIESNGVRRVYSIKIEGIGAKMKMVEITGT